MAFYQQKHTSWLEVVQNFFLNYGIFIFSVLLILFFTFITNTFFTFNNVNGLLHAASPLMLFGAAVSLVLFTGKIDISVGSIAILSCCCGAMMNKHLGTPPVIALIIVLLVGALLGALNGFIIIVLRVNALITTLATMKVFQGIALVMTDGGDIRMPESLWWLANDKIGPVFSDVVLVLIIMVFLTLVVTRTAFGRQLFALGNNEEIAGRLGVRTEYVSFLSFVICGLISSIAGILIVLQNTKLYYSLGQGMEFSAIAAAVIGGVSLFGGVGSILPAVLIGALIINIIQNGLNHMGADPFLYELVNGGIIFTAMAMDSLKTRVRVRRKTIKV